MPGPMGPTGLTPHKGQLVLQAFGAWPHQVCHQALGPELALNSICTDDCASGLGSVCA